MLTPPHPNVETVQPAISAHAPAEGTPECRSSATCHFCTRRWQSVCQQVHAPAFSAYRLSSCGGHTRLLERCNLLFPHATLLSILPESKCPHILCLPHALSSRIFPFPCPNKWGMGLDSMSTHGPSTPDWQSRKILQFRSRRRCSVCQSANALSFSAYRTHLLLALSHFHVLVRGVWGLRPHVHPRPLTFAYRANSGARHTRAKEFPAAS